LPCRYCISSLCWMLWRRSSDSVPYTADTNARNRWRLPDSSRCRTGIEQVNAKHNRANRNSLSSAIENRADDNSDIGFARLCSVCWCHEGAHTKVLKLSAACGHTTWNVPNLEKQRCSRMFDAAWLEIPDFAIRIAAPVAFGTSYISITYKKTYPVLNLDYACVWAASVSSVPFFHLLNFSTTAS
jgi:hypothetical protein